MAGFSLILLMLLFWPVMLVGSIAVMLAVAAAEFVMSPAFPCLVGAALCGTLAAVDVVRVLWRHHKEGEGYPLERRVFVRPAVLCLASVGLFVAMCVVAGSMVLAWWRSIQ